LPRDLMSKGALRLMSQAKALRTEFRNIMYQFPTSQCQQPFQTYTYNDLSGKSPSTSQRKYARNWN
jgi:hypothetical protein